MLDDREQQAWQEIERAWARDARRGGRPRARAHVVAVAVATVVTVSVAGVVVGAPWAGPALVAALLAWPLARWWREVGESCTSALVPMSGWVPEDPPGPDTSVGPRSGPPGAGR
ncbi:hypothetical protein [Geodermatophilus sp. FMUSA9-8]|uniref:hypothetical protein n=1 Tax=Geodermatophilus sp. FMUSA9-8 TaxID=3120155 RepID=UPI00300BCBCA